MHTGSIADQCWHLAIFCPVLFGVSQPAVKNLSILWANANDDWTKNTWVER